MLKVLTEKAGLSCAHGGRVGLEASQDLVRIQGVPALVRPDLLDRPIRACPPREWIAPATKSACPPMPE